MSDLATYLWLRQQWRLFRRILIGALTGVLLVGSSGLVVLRPGETEAEPQWFWARAALMFLLGVASLVTVWLFARATREIRQLGRLATEARIEEARTAREALDPRRPKTKKGNGEA